MKNATIFARARQAPPEAPAAPAPSPAAIAAEVPLGARLQLAEHELRGLRARRQSLVDEARALAQEHRESTSAGGMVGVGRELARLQRKRIDAEDKVRELRPRVMEMRQERATHVAEALAPLRREAAGRALAALGELRDAARIVDEVAVEIERAGGDAVRLRLPALGEIEALLRRAAE